MSGVIGAVRRGLSVSVVVLVGLGLAPAISQAAVVGGALLTGPTTVTVGQTGLAASMTVRNDNTSPDFFATNRVCNAGDAAPCGAPDRGIVLVPACKQLTADGQCAAAGADPDVFRISTTATGTFGTCAGVSFTTEVLQDAFGTVRFTPAGGAHLSLPERDSFCSIAFTFDVLKSPTGDQDPGTAGTQTVQATEHTQCVEPCNPSSAADLATVASTGTTVLRAGPPAITTAASGNINLGGQLTDQATVTRLVNPVAGATMTFRLYPPSAPTCAGAPVFTSTKPVALSGTTAAATSDPFTPTAGGVYHWIATYDGDANNLPISGSCGEATETRTVTAPCTPAPGPPPAGGTLCTTPAPPPPALPPPSPPTTCLGKKATISAAAGQTVVRGTSGPDVIVGGDAGETIDGGGGADTICAGKGNDKVSGGNGDDNLSGGAGNDRISGGSGSDSLSGGAGSDNLSGGSGSDRIRGDGGKDRLSGDGGNDLLLGGSGDDDLRGGSGNDRSGGGDGTDRVDGGSGNDVLDDQKLGGGGRDLLLGGAGADRVRTAGGSSDRVDCGPGRDSVLMDARDRQRRCESIRR